MATTQSSKWFLESFRTSQEAVRDKTLIALNSLKPAVLNIPPKERHSRIFQGKWWLSLNKQHESLGKRESSLQDKEHRPSREWIKYTAAKVENRTLSGPLSPLSSSSSFPSVPPLPFPPLSSFPLCSSLLLSCLLPIPSPFLPSFWMNSILLKRKKRKVI